MSYDEIISLLKAYGKILSFVSVQIYGANSTKLRLSHVQSGSLNIGGAVEILAGMQPVIHSLPLALFGVDTVGDLIKSLFDIFKHLGGRLPKAIENQGDGNIALINDSGQQIVANGNVYIGCQFFGADVIRPLQKPMKSGAEKVTFTQNRRKIAEYSKEEIVKFNPMNSEEKQLINEFDAWITVISPVFEGSSKWKFRYGSATITVEVEDSSFLSAGKNKQVSFTTGKEIYARIRMVQSRKNGRWIAQYFLVNVIEERR